MGQQILVILGAMGAGYGILMYFVGRHIFYTMFGGGILQVGSTAGTLITAAAAILVLLGAAAACVKLAMMLRIHHM